MRRRLGELEEARLIEMEDTGLGELEEARL